MMEPNYRFTFCRTHFQNWPCDPKITLNAVNLHRTLNAHFSFGIYSKRFNTKCHIDLSLVLNQFKLQGCVKHIWISKGTQTKLKYLKGRNPVDNLGSDSCDRMNQVAKVPVQDGVHYTHNHQQASMSSTFIPVHCKQQGS